MSSICCINSAKRSIGSKTLVDHSKKLLVFVQNGVFLGVGSSAIPNIFSSLSILFLLLRSMCSMVLFSISISLNSLINKSIVLLDLVVVSFIAFIAFFYFFHEILQDWGGCFEELIIDCRDFLIEGFHIEFEMILLLAQKG